MLINLYTLYCELILSYVVVGVRCAMKMCRRKVASQGRCAAQVCDISISYEIFEESSTSFKKHQDSYMHDCTVGAVVGQPVAADNCPDGSSDGKLSTVAHGHPKHQSRYKCVAGLLGVRNLRLGKGDNWAFLPHSLGPLSSGTNNETQRKSCFTSVFCEAVVSLWLSRPFVLKHSSPTLNCNIKMLNQTLIPNNLADYIRLTNIIIQMLAVR
uniref:SFRICE_015449 n=1 Tax=Spodoptera frugiperda TaxID=7108 RepID=A0A2H1WF31_SPOFR